MVKHRLTRKQRAAASAFAVIPITVISYMLYHYGRHILALGFEFGTLVLYSVWVWLGPVKDDDDEDSDERE